MGLGRLFVVFLLFVLLEAMLLAKVAQFTGWLFIFLALIASAMLGSLLMRVQGLGTWLRMNQRLQQGEMPGKEMVESVLILMGATLLVIPGFITDVVGLLLLIPPIRSVLAGFLVRRGSLQMMRTPGQGGAFVYTRTEWHEVKDEPEQPRIGQSPDGHLIIEGKAERKDD